MTLETEYKCTVSSRVFGDVVGKLNRYGALILELKDIGEMNEVRFKIGAQGFANFTQWLSSQPNINSKTTIQPI